MTNHILLVDDEALIRRLMRVMLASAGYAVDDVGSAEEALVRMRSEKFDLVVTDNFMGGMSGVELASAIKARTPSVPVVMLSGHPPENHLPCVDLVLRKPSEFRLLLASLKGLMSGAEEITALATGPS